jgi:Dicarboxylate transport
MSASPPNAVQDFAYQALENLAFDQLEGTVNSRPMGRLGVLLHIKGRNDPATAAEPRVGVLDLLRGRAFDKPLPLPKGTPIDLTLDTSLNLDELLNSYFNRAGTNPAAGMGANTSMGTGPSQMMN